MCLLTICISSLEKHTFGSFAHFLIALLGFLLMSCKVLTYSVYYILVRYIIWKYFLPVCRLSFYFLEVQVFNSDEVQFVYFFPFDAYALDGIKEVVASFKAKKVYTDTFFKEFFFFFFLFIVHFLQRILQFQLLCLGPWFLLS